MSAQIDTCLRVALFTCRFFLPCDFDFTYLPDKIHNLVLALPWNIRVRQDHLDALPAGIVVETIVDVVAETVGETKHERSAWEEGDK